MKIEYDFKYYSIMHDFRSVVRCSVFRVLLTRIFGEKFICDIYHYD
jgi:hypothetical protein